MGRGDHGQRRDDGGWGRCTTPSPSPRLSALRYGEGVDAVGVEVDRQDAAVVQPLHHQPVALDVLIQREGRREVEEGRQGRGWGWGWGWVREGVEEDGEVVAVVVEVGWGKGAVRVTRRRGSGEG